MPNLSLTTFARLAAGTALAATLAAPSAQAIGGPPRNFAMACSIGSNQVRVDLTGFVNDGNDNTTKADAKSILYRSLSARDGRTPTTFRPDRVTIDVRDQNGYSSKWTSRGGVYGDGVLVPSRLSWDPNGKYQPTRSWRAIRVTAINTGGTSCASIWFAI